MSRPVSTQAYAIETENGSFLASNSFYLLEIHPHMSKLFTSHHEQTIHTNFSLTNRVGRLHARFRLFYSRLSPLL